MEDEIQSDNQFDLKYFTFIGDPTASLKCQVHANQCKHYCKGCHAPVCTICIANHQNALTFKKDPTSSLSMHKIIEIEQYSKEVLDSYIQSFLDIEYHKKNNTEYFKKRELLQRKETRNFISKLHKFFSHFFMNSQKEIFDTVDEEYSRWLKQKEELTALGNAENYQELFVRRKEVQKSKKEMKAYLRQINIQTEERLFDDIKEGVVNRVQKIMGDLGKVLSFAQDYDNFQVFDDILDSTKIDDIQNKISQQKHLISQENLLEKLVKLKENLNFVLKQIDQVGLKPEYNLLLDINLNPDLKQECQFYLVHNIAIVDRIDRQKGINDSYVYFGQINVEGQMHGIGSMLFKNGFCYSGMFHKGSREGLGVTYDLNGNKYKGEHSKGTREGQGTFKLNDGKMYEGGWSKNKMHGRGRETFENGECFIVYYKDGYKLEALASKSMINQVYHQSEPVLQKRNSDQSSVLNQRSSNKQNNKNSGQSKDSTRIMSFASKSPNESFNKSAEMEKIKKKHASSGTKQRKKSKDDGDCSIF